MPQNSLTLVVDESGMYYRVPICMINEPENFNADFVTQKLFEKAAPKEAKINVRSPLLILSLYIIRQKVKIRSTKGDSSLEKVSNLLSISDLKSMYISSLDEKRQDGLSPDKLRFFCLGKELKDNLFLYSYDIASEMTIQAMVKPTLQ